MHMHIKPLRYTYIVGLRHCSNVINCNVVKLIAALAEVRVTNTDTILFIEHPLHVKVYPVSICASTMKRGPINFGGIIRLT